MYLPRSERTIYKMKDNDCCNGHGIYNDETDKYTIIADNICRIEQQQLM